MVMSPTNEFMPALLISLVLLASIICGLVFVICAVVLCKFCYEKQKNKTGDIGIKKDNNRHRGLPSDDIRLCRKLLGQSEHSKPSEKIILKALDSDLDSSEGSHNAHVDACVQTDETSFMQNNYNFKYQVSGCENATGNMDKNNHLIPNYKADNFTNPQFKKSSHSKSRVKVQIQNYITPNGDSSSLQITQAVVRRFSDNSPYKDDEALEAENYSRGRSASQIPQANKMSPTPSVNRITNEVPNKGQSLVMPATQRRGSHHLRPFDTHWGNNKLSHSMELVSCKPTISTEERKVHSFDNALGRRRAVSTQGGLFQARSLTMSNSDEAASSSLEEPHNQPLLITNRNEEKYFEKVNSPKFKKKNEIPLNEIVVYNFPQKSQLNNEDNFKQHSYQNILEYPTRDNYKARKSYVGEFTNNQEPITDSRNLNKSSSPHKERKVRRRTRGISNKTDSSKDSITINIIDSDSEKQLLCDEKQNDESKMHVTDFYGSKVDPSLSPRSAAAKRHQFSRERHSLVQVGDINEFHHLLESNSKQGTAVKDSDNWNNQRQFLERDYSVDERTSAIFNEFIRPDPKLDKNVMKAQILEKIRTQRKSTCSPIKTNDQSRLKLEYTKAASFAGKEDYQNYITSQEQVDSHLNFPKMSAHQQRRQSINKLKVQSFDQRIQLPVIILPDDSP